MHITYEIYNEFMDIQIKDFMDFIYILIVLTMSTSTMSVLSLVLFFADLISFNFQVMILSGNLDQAND